MVGGGAGFLVGTDCGVRVGTVCRPGLCEGAAHKSDPAANSIVIANTAKITSPSKILFIVLLLSTGQLGFPDYALVHHNAVAPLGQN